MISSRRQDPRTGVWVAALQHPRQRLTVDETGQAVRFGATLRLISSKVTTG